MCFLTDDPIQKGAEGNTAKSGMSVFMDTAVQEQMQMQMCSFHFPVVDQPVYEYGFFSLRKRQSHVDFSFTLTLQQQFLGCPV